jgi:hypothetical protein
MFPKITKPCPAAFKALPSAEKNFCTLCSRKVHNLNALSPQERFEFLRACSGEVCVAYTVQRKPHPLSAKAGLMLAAALASGGAMATEVGALNHGSEEMVEDLEFLGGTMSGDATEWQTQDQAQLALPELNADAPELEFIAAPKSP